MRTIKPIENSSQITRIGHCSATNTLQVTFKGGGSTYEYSNFTPDLWEKFHTAESIGSHFIQNIKKNPDAYPYRKVDPKDVWE